MGNPTYFRLEQVSVIDVTGNDAMTIVHNLTTNEVKSLAIDEGCESFVTDVRGKTIGHVHLFREEGGLRMIGSVGQSERIAAHVDRYTILEDAKPAIRDQDFVVFLLDAAAVAIAGIKISNGERLSRSACRIGGVEVEVYQTRWLGEPTASLLLVPAADAKGVNEALQEKSLTAEDEASFQHARTLAGFPWMGIDLDETNLPQEADRDHFAVSFTKGCYLGQETVARLDALGQVQKKLVRWAITGGLPDPGSTLVSNGKTVGRLTSVAAGDNGEARAIGFARRSHFDSGSTAIGVVESTGTEFTGTVL